MKTKSLLIVGQLLAQSIAFAGDLSMTGRLVESQPGQFELQNGSSSILLSLSTDALRESVSLINKTNYVEIKSFNQVPTIVSGNLVLEGQMTKDSQGYMINGERVIFGPSKKITGGQFNVQSQDYFVGKSVRAVGSHNGADLFVISSIIRDDVFTADPKPLIDAKISKEFIDGFNNDPVGFISDLLDRKVKSPSPAWFRANVFTTENFNVKPGDPVLILSAAGGQNDSVGAVNGHFSSGLGRVGADQKITGEMFNVYVTNEKQIIPGDVDMNDYFGQLISGQLNYRPTYTVLIYGVAEEKILKVRDELDRLHPLFRDGNTKITADKNCVTLSVQALADINFYGEQRNGSPESFKFLSQQDGLPKTLSKKAELEFALKTPVAEFMPGPAFVSFVKNLKYLNEKEQMGITRVDFIFGGQTPSNRPYGLPPTKNVEDNFARQAEIGAKLGVKMVEKKLSVE